MQKFLWISLFIVSIIALISSMIANQRGIKIKEQDKRICGLEASLAEYEKIQQIQEQAEKEAKEFEKELIKDESTDNLDVVPADYIINQLHTD